jgi:hypothetical protein
MKDIINKNMNCCYKCIVFILIFVVFFELCTKNFTVLHNSEFYVYCVTADNNPMVATGVNTRAAEETSENECVMNCTQ